VVGGKKKVPAFPRHYGVSLLRVLFTYISRYQALLTFAGGANAVTLINHLVSVIRWFFLSPLTIKVLTPLLSRRVAWHHVSMVWLVIASMMRQEYCEKIGYIDVL